MHPSIEKLLKVQEIDSNVIFLKESMKMRPRELDSDIRKVAGARSALEQVLEHLKRMKMDSAAREVDVKKYDQDIEKIRVALNQSKSNSEYTIYKEQIKKQEEARGKVEEEVLNMFTECDLLEAKRKELEPSLKEAEKVFSKKNSEMSQLLEGMRGQVQALEEQRGGLVEGIELEQLKLYERVLARHNNFAIARVDNQVCQGCFMSVTTQEITHLRGGQFIQCKSCSRILYLG